MGVKPKKLTLNDPQLSAALGGVLGQLRWLKWQDGEGPIEDKMRNLFVKFNPLNDLTINTNARVENKTKVATLPDGKEGHLAVPMALQKEIDSYENDSYQRLLSAGSQLHTRLRELEQDIASRGPSALSLPTWIISRINANFDLARQSLESEKQGELRLCKALAQNDYAKLKELVGTDLSEDQCELYIQGLEQNITKKYDDALAALEEKRTAAKESAHNLSSSLKKITTSELLARVICDPDEQERLQQIERYELNQEKEALQAKAKRTEEEEARLIEIDNLRTKITSAEAGFQHLSDKTRRQAKHLQFIQPGGKKKRIGGAMRNEPTEKGGEPSWTLYFKPGIDETHQQAAIDQLVLSLEGMGYDHIDMTVPKKHNGEIDQKMIEQCFVALYSAGFAEGEKSATIDNKPIMVDGKPNPDLKISSNVLRSAQRARALMQGHDPATRNDVLARETARYKKELQHEKSRSATAQEIKDYQASSSVTPS